MDDIQFFDHIAAHFDDALPFVAYRKPGEKTVQLFFQEDNQLRTTSNYTESGFVFAPFDTRNSAAILIENKQSLSCQYGSEEIGQKGKIQEDIRQGLTPDETDKAHHIGLVDKAISEIQKGRMQKVVLSRKQALAATSLHPVVLFKRLLNSYTTAFVYCWYHPKVGLWLGATPETLLSVANRKLHTMSLAGTQLDSGSTPPTWGAKEKEEQQMVTNTIVDSLRSLVSEMIVSDVQTHKAGNLLHLKTDVMANFNENTSSIKAVIEALHPTPAVCGLPKSLARDFILENENYDRSFYTGFLGELNIKKEKKRAATRRNVENLAYGAIKKSSHLFVNLRCMEIDATGAQLYVGGGITASSDAILEWEETVNKLETVGRVLSQND